MWTRQSVRGLACVLLFAISGVVAAAPRDRVVPNTHECFRYDTYCGSTVESEITIYGCRYVSGTQTKYWTRYRLTLSGQADVTATVTSTEFIPEVGLSNPDDEVYTAYEFNNNRRNTISVTARMPGNSFVDIDIYAKSADTGRFQLNVSCAACAPPVITQNPLSTTVPYGGRATLTVEAIGKEPLRYAWYDASNPNAAIGAGAQFVTPPVTGPATYFAQAINECGQVRSLNAIVEAGPCSQPTVQVPAAIYTVARGGSVTLEIYPGGSGPHTIQWYEGSSPDTSRPVPMSNTNRLTLAPALHSGSYWARVMNACGFTDTTAIRVDVTGSSKRRSARH